MRVNTRNIPQRPKPAFEAEARVKRDVTRAALGLEEVRNLAGFGS